MRGTPHAEDLPEGSACGQLDVRENPTYIGHAGPVLRRYQMGAHTHRMPGRNIYICWKNIYMLVTCSVTNSERHYYSTYAS